MSRRYKKKGFTLLELMIVVIIVGILASLAMPRFITATRKAKEAEAKALLGAIRSAQIRYYLENNEVFTGTIGDLDIDLTPSQYYTYAAVAGGGGAGSAIGTATAIVTGIASFSIDEEGTIW